MTPAPAPAGTRCPGCDGDALTDVLSAGAVPVFVGVLHDSAEESRRAPTGDITLAFCHVCGLVHNRRFEPRKLAFAPGYDTSLIHSAEYRAFLDQLADRLVERYDLRGRTVLEVGCGAGHFLRRLAERGIGRGIGVDPAVPRVGPERVGEANVEWVRDWFDPAKAGTMGDWDFVCALSMLEDVPRPLEMVAGLARLCAERVASAYVDVFHAQRAFEGGEIWSAHYEQCNYFGAASLAGLFERGGFHVRDAGACYADGRFVFVEVEPRPHPATRRPPAGPLGLPLALAELSARHDASVEVWTGRIARLHDAGRRVVLWGTGGKGISFLAAVPTSDRIACAVDVNPDRRGRWLPGSGLRVAGPEDLVALRPDVVIVTNPLHAREVQARVASLRLSCEILAA